MVLSSWLFVLGKLKLLFFLWRREQQEPSPCGDEDSEDVREPVLFISEISKQLDWNVCSSTNSWFCREGWHKCRLRITQLHHWLPLLNSELRCCTRKAKRTEQDPQKKNCLIIGKWIIEGIENTLAQMSVLSAICENIHNCYIPVTNDQKLKVSLSWIYASRGQSDATQDLMSCPDSRILPCTFPLWPLHYICPCIMHTVRCLMQTCAAVCMAWSLYGAFPRRWAGLLRVGGGGIIIREEEHWFTAFLCLYTEFKAASVKLMSQPSIKEALTSLNYRWSKITYAGLFEGNNVSGRQSHVIFSMLPERGLNISRPHLRLFLTSTAYKMT